MTNNALLANHRRARPQVATVSTGSGLERHGATSVGLAEWHANGTLAPLAEEPQLPSWVIGGSHPRLEQAIVTALREITRTRRALT